MWGNCESELGFFKARGVFADVSLCLTEVGGMSEMEGVNFVVAVQKCWFIFAQKHLMTAPL